jgi:hypothetical protein
MDDNMIHIGRSELKCRPKGHKYLDMQGKGGTSVKLEQTVLCTPLNIEKEHHKTEHFSVSVTTSVPCLRGICLKFS